MLKKVRVRGVLVDFRAKSISAELVNAEPYGRLYANPNYPEILRMLTNGQGEWKLNNEGHTMHFKANTWHISLRCGTISSPLVSFRRQMYMR